MRINELGLNISEVLKKVKQDVFAESNEKQLPSLEDNSIGGDFFFTPGSSTTTTTQPITQPIVKTEPAYVAPVTTAISRVAKIVEVVVSGQSSRK